MPPMKIPFLTTICFPACFCCKMRKIGNYPLSNRFHMLISKSCLMQRTEYGGIAQLGERLNGIQEVSGSIPLISTRKSSEIA